MREEDLPTAVARLAQSQAHCVARHQLHEHGVGPDAVRRRLGRTRWQRVGPRVVVLHTGPLDLGARRWAALLHVGPAAVLAAWAALTVHGLEGWAREEVHVAVPHGGSRTPSVPDVVAHVAHRARPEEVTVRRGLPVHRVERAALDAAAWSAAPLPPGRREACWPPSSSSGSRRPSVCTGGSRSSGLCGTGPSWPGVLEDLAGGSQSMAEIDLVRLCRAHQLPVPVPVRQSVRVDAAGRRRHLDAEWRPAVGRRVVVEVDGIGHPGASRWYDDLLRAAEVSRAGESLLRLPAMALRVDVERVVALLRLHLTPCP